MPKSILRGVANRVLHFLARFGPGSTSLRPFLHRLRGVKIGRNVFIGDDVYLDNEYPEQIEIQDGVQISIRATLLAHTRGAGTLVLERDCYIGPHVLIVTAGGKELRIGEGAVIAGGCVVTRDVKARIFMAGEFGRPIAEAHVPLTKSERMEDFIRGLTPIRPPDDAPAPANHD
jgi:acetyltransferase-like isoleucine patch superfamily enzyme